MSFKISDIPLVDNSADISTVNDSLTVPTKGIPQSRANPLLDVFGAPDYRDDHEKAMDTWRQESATALDVAILDPKSYGDERVPHGYTPDEWRKTRVVDDWMRLHTDGQEPPMDSMGREFARGRLAQQVFDGAGAENDDALFGEITKAATGRKEVKEIRLSLGKSATNSAAVGLASPDKAAGGWAAARDAARKMPGFRPDMEADLHEAYYQAERSAKDALEPFESEVKELWKSWQEADGAGKVTSVLKEPTAVGVISALASDKKSTRATAFDIYDKLTPAERPEFMQALAVMASNVPKEDQPRFFANIAKQSGRDIEALVQKAGTATGEFFSNPDNWDTTTATGKPTDYRRKSDFVQQLQDLQEGKFDPVKKVSDGWWGKLGETVAYGTTGVLATSAMAANPYTAPALFASLTESHYQSLLQSQVDNGISYDKASNYASRHAMEGAVIETISEKFGSNLLRGKLPFFDKALTGAMDKLKNPLLRAGTRFLAGGAEEGALEIGQNYIDPMIRGISKAFGEDTGTIIMPNAQENIETFALVLPLALMGIPGAAGRDARVNTFAAASDLQMTAAGYSAEGVKNIRDGIAKGLDSGAAAIDGQLRTPEAPEAVAAQAAIKVQLATQRQAQEDLRNLGYAELSLVRTNEGITVFDGDGQELGSAADLSGAVRLARTHTGVLDNMEANNVAALGSLMEATEAAVKLDPKSTLEVNFGVFDPAQASPEMAASYLQQVALKEVAEGGTGKIARSVLGYSVTGWAQGARNTVNRLFQGASVTDVFHETAHGARRGAHAAGVLSLKDDVELLRSHDTVLAGRRVKALPGEAQGTEARFIPEGLTDEMLLNGDLIPADMIPAQFHGNGKLYVEKLMDEGVSEITESEVFRPKKGQGKGKLGIGRAVVSRNITALAKLMPGTIGNWVAYFRAVRAQWGLTATRAVAMRGAERRGEWDPSTKDAYMAKLFGLDQQDEHDAGVKSELARLLGEPDGIAEDDIPFSIGRSTVTPTAETRAFQGAEGSPSVIGPAAFSIRAYHATPHKVDKFSTDKIGTGEGTQFQGWGLYFSGDEKPHQVYVGQFSQSQYYAKYEGEPISSGTALMKVLENTVLRLADEKPNYDREDFFEEFQYQQVRLMNNRQSKEKYGNKSIDALADVRAEFIELGDSEQSKPNQYGVRLNVDDASLLLWDAPLSEQSPQIRKNLGEVADDSIHGREFYSWLAKFLKPEGASKRLLEMGIRGIRYLDGNSRADGEGSYNYVIFDDADIEIVEENGTPVEMGGASFSIGTRPTVTPLKLTTKDLKSLSATAFNAAALSELKTALTGVRVTVTTDVAGENATAEFETAGNELVSKLRTQKTTYESLINCLGKKSTSA